MSSQPELAHGVPEEVDVCRMPHYEKKPHYGSPHGAVAANARGDLSQPWSVSVNIRVGGCPLEPSRMSLPEFLAGILSGWERAVPFWSPSEPQDGGYGRSDAEWGGSARPSNGATSTNLDWTATVHSLQVHNPRWPPRTIAKRIGLGCYAHASYGHQITVMRTVPPITASIAHRAATICHSFIGRPRMKRCVRDWMRPL